MMKRLVCGLNKQRKMRMFILFIFSLICSSGFASLEYHEVIVEGRGPTLGAAVNEALVEAVGRINGKSIDASSMLSSSELSTVNGNDADYFASESFQRKIASATKGVVSSYEVLESSETSGGRWQVSVCAKIGKYKRSAKSKRKRIAIMPLRVSSAQFSVGGYSFNKNEAARMLGDGVNARLVQSRRFTVLDRNYMNETLGEKNLIISGDVPMEEMARLGEELASDYIVVGTLEDVKLSSKRIKLASGRTINTCSGGVVLGFRVIEVATRQVAFAEVLSVPVSSLNDSQAGSSGVNGDVMDMLLPVADEVSEKILSAIYPLIVVQVRNDRVVLGQGGSGIKEGTHYKVYQYGERLIDPYTGESLGRDEVYCAEIEVERVLPKQSYAKVVHSDVDLSSVFAPKTLVCRAISKREFQEKQKADRDVRMKGRRESLNNDW